MTNQGACQQQSQGFPLRACQPSRATTGMRHSAATGSAHVIPRRHSDTRPASAMIDKYPHSADSAAFCSQVPHWQSRWTTCASAVPAGALQPLPHSIQQSQVRLGFTSRWPSSANAATSATYAANANRRPPVILAANRSVCSPLHFLTGTANKRLPLRGVQWNCRRQTRAKPGYGRAMRRREQRWLRPSSSLS